MIVLVDVVLNRTVVVDNLCGSHLQSQSELITSIILSRLKSSLLLVKLSIISVLLVLCRFYESWILTTRERIAK